MKPNGVLYLIDNPIAGHYYRIKLEGEKGYSYIALSLTKDEIIDKMGHKSKNVKEITKEEFDKAICGVNYDW